MRVGAALSPNPLVDTSLLLRYSVATMSKAAAARRLAWWRSLI
jgi:hypothetical protein